MTKGSSAYHFVKILSENQNCCTWLATSRTTGERCVVKTAAAGLDSDRDKNNHILTTSYLLQRQLHSKSILRAIRRVAEEGSAFIEYPYLDPAEWQPLSPEVFRRYAETLLPQICVTVDYLHSLGLVHADLKLENFLVSSGGRDILLADLDFLCVDGTSPEANIIGTREHIAPEVLANDRLVIQSDIFSLGISFRRFLDDASSDSTPVHQQCVELLTGLRTQVSELLEPDYLKRPRMLLDFAARHQLLSKNAIRESEERLFGPFLLTKLWGIKRSRLSDASKLDSFLHHDCHVLGFHPDAIAALAEAWGKSRVRALRALVKLLSAGEVSRHYEFWHLNPSLEQLTDFYAELETISGNSPEPRPDQSPSEYWLSRGAQFRDLGLPERALLAYHRGQGLSGGERKIASAEDQASILLEAGRLAGQVGRSELAREYFDQARTLITPESGIYLAVMLELALAYLKGEQLARVRAIIDEGLAVKPTDEVMEFYLKLRRLRGWLQMRSSDYAAAGSEFREIIEIAQQRKLAEVEALGTYALGAMELRQGNPQTALRQFTAAFEIARRGSLKRTMAVASSMLAAVCAEMSRYAETIKYGKLSAQLAEAAHSAAVNSSVYSALAGAYTRMGKFSEAHFWCERHLQIAFGGTPAALLQWYYADEGYVKTGEGDLRGAERSYFRALEIARTESSFGALGKILKQLAVIGLFTGKPDRMTGFADEARKVFAEQRDEGSLTEVNLVELLARAQGEGDWVFDKVVEAANRLIEFDCGYFAGMAVLQLLLLDDDSPGPWLRALHPRSAERFEQSKSHFLLAINELAAALGKPASIGERLKAWKNAFQQLYRHHEYFWASRLALHIGELYLHHNQPRHAKTFLKKGRELAATLPNDILVGKADTMLIEAERQGGDVSTLVSSFVAISNILKEVTDFGGSLDRLIQFAVDQTGAERGVLLLKSPTSPNLQVGSAVNCDEQSLSDVLQISSKLPQSAFEEALPIVIDNAMMDERTKDYKSVHMHNVLSVACVPLIHINQVVGVLYLDHHSIPALFEPDDLRYIESIANFLTVFLVMAREVRILTTSHRELQGELSALGTPEGFLTRDPAMLRLLDQLPHIAKTNANILLLGESGTGKELLCGMIHRLSQRAKEPLVKFNCASVSPSMIDSELFGVARNAATGVAPRDGKFAAADGGTLFLDEIGDMPLEMQAKVLRVLEYLEFEKVGSNRPIRVDVRFVHATNKNLPEMIAERKFREDLYFRINTVVIEVPALRDRPVDIPLLLDHYLLSFSKGRKTARFTSEAMEKLLCYRWPGNARELRNLVERTCILYPGRSIEVNMLPAEIAGTKSDFASARTTAERIEAAAMTATLIRANGNQSLAAKEMGMPLSTFRRKMKKYGIRFDQ